MIEAKDNRHTVGAGLQQALGYAQTLDVPFAFSSNGDGFLFHDRTVSGDEMEQQVLESQKAAGALLQMVLKEALAAPEEVLYSSVVV